MYQIICILRGSIGVRMSFGEKAIAKLPLSWTELHVVVRAVELVYSCPLAIGSLIASAWQGPYRSQLLSTIPCS